VRGTVTRGTLYLGLQQVVAFLAMMVLHVASGRYFGPEVYGLFFVVNAVLTLLLVTFLSGIPHAVAKFTAEDTRKAIGILGRGFLIQCALSIVLAVALASTAGPLARLLGNASYEPLLRIGALAVPLLALAHLFIHVLNGMQWFRRQALALGALNVFKTLAVLFALGYLKGGARSAVWGLVAAAGLSMIVAGAFCRHLRGGDRASFPGSGGSPDAPVARRARGGSGIPDGRVRVDGRPRVHLFSSARHAFSQHLAVRRDRCARGRGILCATRDLVCVHHHVSARIRLLLRRA
jgi:O-antigen/teichoic acid export membrane protein